MSVRAPRASFRLRLWVKLALFAAVGVVLTHSIHLFLANRITSRALSDEQDALGRTMARIVAHEASDAVLVSDVIALHELVTSTTASRDVAYCFVVRDDEVLASSFPGATPEPLLALRSAGEETPVVVVSGGARYLDVVEPVVGVTGAVVRLGMDMSIVQRTRRTLAALLGSLAVGVIALGVAAAFVVGKGIASPIGELVRAADRFDPTEAPVRVRPRGSVEIVEVTERFNQMMERLKTAHDEQVRARNSAMATERMAALGSLVGGVAHEVNNPLAGVRNCVRRLQRDGLKAEKRQEYLELMDEGLQRIEEVVRRLLDYGRPRPLALAPTPLAKLAGAGPDLVRPLLRKRRIELVEGAGDALGDEMALADPKQVGQALLNLLLNAAYFTPEGGQIRLGLRARPGFVGLSVEDDGPGIPTAIRDRVLLPYFSTKPEGEGTGLGLSVTHTIVDAHGGELALEFPERGGTVVTLWLRRAETA